MELPIRIDRLNVGNMTFSGQLDMNGNKIVNLGTPTAAADATTKAYVDAIATSGIPAGATTQIQFNNAGMFGGDANLTWTASPGVLAVSGSSAKVVIGSQTPADMAAIQIRGSVFASPVSLPIGPGIFTYNSAATGAGSIYLFAPSPANKTMCYFDLTILGVITAGTFVGDTAAFKKRFSCKSLGGTVTLNDIVTEYAFTGTSSIASVDITAVGASVIVNVYSNGGDTYAWTCNAVVTTTAQWP